MMDGTDSSVAVIINSNVNIDEIKGAATVAIAKVHANQIYLVRRATRPGYRSLFSQYHTQFGVDDLWQVPTILLLAQNTIVAKK